MFPHQDLLLTVFTNFFFFGFVICSDPPVQGFSISPSSSPPPPPLTWENVINTGCRYNSHRGIYQLIGNCDITGVIIPGKFSSSIPTQNVVCCISALCQKTPNNPEDAYSCMNTENSNFCFNGLGRFVSNLCSGFPDYVQCCTETPPSPEASKDMADVMPDDPLTPYNPSSGSNNPLAMHYDQDGNPINIETQPEFVPNQDYWRG